jgi:hypothetical protein
MRRFVKSHPFTVSLYNTDDVKLTRDALQQTATNAAMITGGTHEVLPFVALGASIHRNATAPDINWQGNHTESASDKPFFQTTFDFSALLDGGYDRSNSMLLGAQVNLPMFNSSTSRSVWTSGPDTGPISSSLLSVLSLAQSKHVHVFDLRPVWHMFLSYDLI